ncbi:MAG: TlpA family protein disulfide reductase [Bacteroidetes bacterium]|nr:TlpA family protein disulfide reductase [Bacteroidota bacterium]
MKKVFAAITLMLIAMATITAQEGDGTILKKGDKAHLFKATTIDGTVVDLNQMKGKVVMVMFFATWCGPCNLELPVLEKNIWNKYRDNKDFVLLVMGREHDVAALKAFAVTKKLNLPFAPDLNREVFSKYAEKTIPRNYIINKDGIIEYSSIGYTPNDFKMMEDYLAWMLK